MNENIQKAIDILKAEFENVACVELMVEFEKSFGGNCLRIHGYKGDLSDATSHRIVAGDFLSKEVNVDGFRVIYFGEVVPLEPSTANASNLPCLREQQFDAG